MKKFAIVLLAIITLLSINSNAQVRKLVLLEEATNASCPPCAANNPKLQAFMDTYFGAVISVRYHAWWPGDDPMYSLNTADNSARINYYGINGVPDYLIDGKSYGVPSNPDAMYQQMNERLAIQSPVKISVEMSVDSDSLYSTVKIKAYADLPPANYKLRASIIEREIKILFATWK